MNKSAFILVVGLSNYAVAQEAVNEVEVIDQQASTVISQSLPMSKHDVGALKEKEPVQLKLACGGALEIEQDKYAVCEGGLRDNVTRLANELDMAKVVWSKVPHCVDWATEGNYEVDQSAIAGAKTVAAGVFGYVFDGYPLVPEIATRGNLLIVHPTKKFNCGE